MDKKELRKELLRIRSCLTKEELDIAKNRITESLYNHPSYYRADAILVYVSYDSELSTLSFIPKALSDGKKVFVPLVYDKGLMEFHQIDKLEELKEGYHGILEPPKENSKWEKGIYDSSWMILPGVGFDEDGYRLGYGGGFYDRYLERYPELLEYSIAIGHTCQLVDHLPVSEYDQKPGEVLLV